MFSREYLDRVYLKAAIVILISISFALQSSYNTLTSKISEFKV